MIRKLEFVEIVEAVDELSPDEQAELVHLVQKRLAERGHARVVEEVAQGRREAAAGLAAKYRAAEFLGELSD